MKLINTVGISSFSCIPFLIDFCKFLFKALPDSCIACVVVWVESRSDSISFSDSTFVFGFGFVSGFQ